MNDENRPEYEPEETLPEGYQEMRVEIRCRFKPGDPDSVQYGTRNSRNVSPFNMIQLGHKLMAIGIRGQEQAEAEMAREMMAAMPQNRAERRSKGGILIASALDVNKVN